MNRRTLMKSIVSLSLVSMAPGRGFAEMDADGLHGLLPARAEGEMDIHHIDTGRGNCTLIVGPDGTAIMIDAGAGNAPADTSSEERPNASQRAGVWQARYALRQVPSGRLDYFVTTHLHSDHMGDVAASSPMAARGLYRLTGVSDVDALMPIGVLIDRSYPHYGQTPPPDLPATANYLAYLESRVASGRTVEAAAVGSAEQIRLKDTVLYPDFSVRMLAANGRVWTGSGDAVEAHVPDLSRLPATDRPGENVLSVAMKFHYGKFSYFAAGDLCCDTEDGRLPWWDVETPVVRVAGRTEVAAADHHGYFDACGPEFVRSLDAQAFVIQAWDIGHPGTAQMQRMMGAWPGDKPHDVFATDLLPANALMNRRFAPQLKSRRGHVVVRVAKGGASYRILIVDSSQEVGAVTAAFGPYLSRG
jgi:beta-lactamase superfamily II metal-dependent hydrolase